MNDKHDMTPSELALGVSYADGAGKGARGCGGCGGEKDTDRSVCGFGVEKGVVASVYAPLQTFDGIYDVDSALRRGTLFEALDKPFYGDGREVNCRGQYREK